MVTVLWYTSIPVFRYSFLKVEV